MGLLVRWLILTVAIIVASYLIQGIEVSGFFSAFFAAAILGVLNVFFRPILLILTLPWVPSPAPKSFAPAVAPG